MKNFNFTRLLAIGLFCIMPLAGLHAEDNEQVKGLLKEGLELYNQKQYVRALDLFKQAQNIDANNALAAEYIKSTKQRILEWENQSGDGEKARNSTTWDSLLNNKSGLSERDTAANAKDIIAARKSLVERMKNRSTNIDNIVQIQDNGKSVDIVLFHDQLFVPGLTILRDEAFPVLTNVSDVLKKAGDKVVTVRSVTHEESQDPTLLYPEFSLPAAEPGVKSAPDPQTLFQDLEATRAYILFTYIAQKSMDKVANASLE